MNLNVCEEHKTEREARGPERTEREARRSKIPEREARRSNRAPQACSNSRAKRAARGENVPAMRKEKIFFPQGMKLNIFFLKIFQYCILTNYMIKIIYFLPNI